MILLRNKNHGENMRAFMGIFTTPLWNKTENAENGIKLKMANAVHCLFSDRLLSGNEAILASYTFLGLLFLREREIRRNNGGILVFHQYNR